MLVLGLVSERPEWRGPFDTIEDACQIIASLTAADLRRRHAAHIESYRIKPGDPLFGNEIGKRRSKNGKLTTA